MNNRDRVNTHLPDNGGMNLDPNDLGRTGTLWFGA